MEFESTIMHISFNLLLIIQKRLIEFRFAAQFYGRQNESRVILMKLYSFFEDIDSDRISESK